jgi:acylphosphatase
MHYLQLRVQGRVQRVGFRQYVAGEARRLRLRGTVRNLPDGDVEVIAEGEQEPLLQLVERVRTGPPGAVVTHLAEQWAEGPPRYTHFGINS